MSKLFDNIIAFFLFILILGIVSLTTYFCLDLLGIITVPEKYSLASYFFQDMDVVVEIEEGKDLSEDSIDNRIKRYAETKDKNTEQTSSTSMEELLASMENANSNDGKDISQEMQNQMQTVSVKYFYYSQLDKYGKIIYDNLCANKSELKSGTYTCNFGSQFNDLLHQDDGTEILNNSFQLAINALTFDNPELFYIDVTKMYLMTEITTKAFSKSYVVKIGGNGESYLADEFNSAESVNAAINKIENTKDFLVEYSNQTNNDIEKIKVIHDYLVDTVEYDSYAGSNVYNIYGALINKKSVCEGYARSFKYILDTLNIPCIIACGIAENSSGNTESHAWNYVKIDGNWYAIDVTWDDPIIIGNGKVNESVRYQYFLKGSNEFFVDHHEDGNIVGSASFKYPALSENNF